MAIHKLERTQTLAAAPQECWAFFSDPKNLAKITPPDLGFEVISALPARIYEGLLIEYRVRPLFGLKMSWLTEITHVEEGRYFCDEQRVGPYALWHHEHFFEPAEGGGTRMRDLVHYVLPLSPFSEVVHPVLVAPRLEQIFDYRRKAVEAGAVPGGVS